MEKKKLAQLVLEKMKSKKQEEEKNRPHYEVLRLEALFQKEFGQIIKSDIQSIEKELSREKIVLQRLEEHLQELDSSGKRDFPRIIIKPQFIASQNIQPIFKEFFRKASNSFLRMEILRKRSYDLAIEYEADYIQMMASIRQLEKNIKANRKDDRRREKEKRVRQLNEELRIRFLIEEQQSLSKDIKQQQDENRQLLTQYQIKKINSEKRKRRLVQIDQSIINFKNKIVQNFQPTAYREFLKKTFSLSLKNQFLENNLEIVRQKLQTIMLKTKQQDKKIHIRNRSIPFGKITDSPSSKKGKIQKRLQQQRKKRISTEFFSCKSPVTQMNSRASSSFQVNNQTKGKKQKHTNNLYQSIKTTDRSFGNFKFKTQPMKESY